MKKEKYSLTKILIAVCIIGLTGCSTTPSTNNTLKPTNLSSNDANAWNQWQHISSARLNEMQTTITDPTQLGWIHLALISKQKNNNSAQFAQALTTWREHYPNHPGNALIPDNATLQQMQTTTTPQHIAILLPQSGSYSKAGQAVREGFLNAYYRQNGAQKPSIKFYDTEQVADMNALYQQALTDGADFVIGPLIKNNVQQLSSAGTFTAPTLALNYTENRFRSLPNNFYEYGLLPEDEVGQIATRAQEAGRTKALVIAPQTEWGKRLTTSFTSQWKSKGGSIQETWYYPAKADFNAGIAQLLKINPDADKSLARKEHNRNILEKQRRQDFDVVFLFAQPQEARLIVPVLRYYYVSNIPIYATSSVYSSKPNPAKDVDLNGVIVCDIPARNQDNGNGRLYAVGQDAFTLSQNLQRLSQLQNFPMYGATGALSLSSKQQIHRRLPCVAVHDGFI